MQTQSQTINNNPLVSVVVPVYNGAEFITESLNRVLAQTYQPLEVIVIDDGSKDNTVVKLKAFGDKITWKSIPNQGPANARNVGLSLAKGEYIAFLDADDLWFETKVSRQMESFAAFPEVGFSCCNFMARRGGADQPLTVHFSMLGISKDLIFDVPYPHNPFILLMRENFVGTASNVVVKKSLVDKVGRFNTKYVNSQEFECWLRCALATKFFIQSDVLMEKQSHPGNWSGQKIRSYTFQKMLTQDTINNNYQYLKDNGLLDECYFTLARKNYDLGNLHFENKDVKKAFSLYWEGFQTTLSFRNLCLFLSVISKKGLRLLSGGFLSKKKIKGLMTTKT